MKKIIISLPIIIILILTIPPLISTLKPSEPAVRDVFLDGEEDERDGTFSILMHFAGDVLLAENLDAGRTGGFNEYASRESADYFLKNAAPYFLNDDFTVVNLENVFSDRALAPAQKPLPAYCKIHDGFGKLFLQGRKQCVFVPLKAIHFIHEQEHRHVEAFQQLP